MDNNTEDREKRLTNVDTATMWIEDAKEWMDVAERLDRESGLGQDDNPTNHHKRNVAHACTGLAFELAYKSLLVAEFKMPEETHSIEKLHKRLKVETQRIVEEWVKEAGWEESDALLKFFDKYMAHPDIKYRLDNPWEKEKRDPGFTLTGLRTIPELAKILYQLVSLGEQNLAEAREMSTPNQLDPQDALNAVLEIIGKIAEKSVNGNYIYRGEPKYYDKVSSTLYRQYEDDIEAERFEIEVAQGEMLKDAEDYIHETDKEFEILTQLQHYGGKTNLIDFTTDYLIALFFACDGFFDEPGRVILLGEGAQRENQVKKPRSVINRVRDQKSIFARPPKGFIEIESDDAINIPEWLKQPILKHLEKYHGISTKTIYNDLHGFIRVQDLYQSVYTEFFKGLTCHSRKQYDKAIEHYSEALRQNPRIVAAYTNRGVAYSDKGDFDRAIKDCNKAIDIDPDYAEAYINRGAAYSGKGDYDRAIADYTKAIELNPDFAEAYNNRGAAYQRKGDYDRAIRDCNKAIDIDSNYAEAYNNRGAVYIGKGDIDRAIADYTKVIELNPDYAMAYYNRGVVCQHQGDFDLAIDDCTKAIELNPDYADAYYYRAMAYGSKGDFDLAIDDHTKAIELSPDYAEAYYYRAMAYHVKDDINRAIKDCTKAIELNPDYAEAYYYRAIAYHDKGDFDLAIDDFTKAIELNPDYAEAYYNRGEAWLHLGEWRKAKSDLTTARDMGEDIITSFHNNYGSIAGFERITGIQLPADIAAILTPPQ